MLETRYRELSDADRRDALEVVERASVHKANFFLENDASGQRINYEAAVSGGLQLVPSGAAYGVLADDYARMQADRMLLDESEPFDAFMELCAAIDVRAGADQTRVLRPGSEASRNRNEAAPARRSPQVGVEWSSGGDIDLDRVGEQAALQFVLLLFTAW